MFKLFLKKNCTIIATFSIFLFACENNLRNNKNDAISLSPIKEISMLADSSFFGVIADMQFSNKTLTLADNTPQIFRVGQNFNLKGRIDKTGKGPGEFTSINKISIANDSLYAFNRTQAKMLVFDGLDNFMREMSIDEFVSDFNVTKNVSFFLSTPYREKLITVLNAEGKEINTFGDQIVERSSVNIARNRRVLLIHEDKLIAIPQTDSWVKVYNLDGKLLNKKIINHPLLENRIEYNKNRYDSPKDRAGVLFWDGTVFKNKIYLLAVTGLKEEPKPKYTFVLSYTLGRNGELDFNNAFKLFRTNQANRIHGIRLGTIGDHSLVVYDLTGRLLAVYKDERI